MAERTLEQNISQVISDLNSVKNAIVASGVEVASGTPTSQYASKVSEVYQKGKAEGGGGTTDTWYDTFWDVFQDNGERTDYYFSFAYFGWTDETFSPKYDLYVEDGASMFEGSRIIDIKGCLERNEVALDTSGAVSLQYAFAFSSTTRLPIIDASGVSQADGIANMFQNAFDLIWVDGFVIPSSSRVTYDSVFFGTESLEHIIFIGTMIKNFDISASGKLDIDSLLSIIQSLRDYSGTSTTRTATIGTDNLARLSDEEKAIAVGKGWTLA